MKIMLITFSLLNLGFSATIISWKSFSQCTCKHAMLQTDCDKDFCLWDSESGICQQKQCSTYNKEYCLGMLKTYKCVWNYSNSKCENFTKCSDYTFQIVNQDSCNKRFFQCEPDLNSIDSYAKTIKCKDKTYYGSQTADCNLIPYSSCFWVMTPDGKQCQINKAKSTCEAKTITKCSDYDQDNCNILACYWKDNVCTELTCSLLPQQSCKGYLSIDSQSLIWCSWNGKACVDLEIASLTKAECAMNKSATYRWNTNTQKCELCVTPEDYSSLQN